MAKKIPPSQDDIPVRPDGLQLHERRGFQRRMWRLQRIVWIGLGLFVIAALAGATGRGGYAHHRQMALSSGEIDCPRVTRWGAADQITVTFNGPGPHHVLRLEAPFFANFEVERIQPEPRLTRLSQEGEQLEFDVSGPGPHKVQLSIRAAHFGLIGFGAVLDGVATDISMLILP